MKAKGILRLWEEYNVGKEEAISSPLYIKASGKNIKWGTRAWEFEEEIKFKKLDGEEYVCKKNMCFSSEP